MNGNPPSLTGHTPDDAILRWIRNEDQSLRLFKHNSDLYSDELADEGDPYVVLKARVRLTGKTREKSAIVAIPVSRQLLAETENSNDGPALFFQFTTEVFRTVERLETSRQADE